MFYLRLLKYPISIFTKSDIASIGDTYFLRGKNINLNLLKTMNIFRQAYRYDL